MSRVFFDVGMSLDGFIAGPSGGAKNPLGDEGIKIHDWMFKQRAFLKHLKLEGGETNNPDNDLIEKTFNRFGANIMGKNMFVEGEANWPEEAPFHCPVYVLTNEKREPWGRPGATTFYFVSYNIKTVLEKAGEAAGSNDVRISNGAQTIQRYLNGGLIDEINIHIAPITIGKGVRLFENIEKEKFTVEIIDVTNPPMVAHLFYKVINH